MPTELERCPEEKWEAAFSEMLNNLEPGIYLNLFHIAMNTPEFRALAYADPSFYLGEQSWTWLLRPKLYEIYTSTRIKKVIRELGIELASYRRLISLKTQK